MARYSSYVDKELGAKRVRILVACNEYLQRTDLKFTTKQWAGRQLKAYRLYEAWLTGKEVT